jgi:hypothetical protein
MGNALSKIMDYVGKKLIDIRKGSPRYRRRKRRWKNKDIQNYRMVRGEDDWEDELYEWDEERRIEVVQL